MKTVAAILLVSALAGCALSPEARQAKLRNTSTDELCFLGVTKPAYRADAEAELRTRGGQCDWAKVQLMMQNQAAAEQRFQQSLMNLQQAVQMTQPQPARPALQCASSRLGQNVNTTCY